MIAVGTFIALRTDLIISWFGRTYWAEAKLGGGGSWLLYKLLGILIVVIGVIVTTDLFDIVIGEFIVNLLT